MSLVQSELAGSLFKSWVALWEDTCKGFLPGERPPTPDTLFIVPSRLPVDCFPSSDCRGLGICLRGDAEAVMLVAAVREDRATQGCDPRARDGVER